MQEDRLPLWHLQMVLMNPSQSLLLQALIPHYDLDDKEFDRIVNWSKDAQDVWMAISEEIILMDVGAKASRRVYTLLEGHDVHQCEPSIRQPQVFQGIPVLRNKLQEKLCEGWTVKVRKLSIDHYPTAYQALSTVHKAGVGTISQTVNWLEGDLHRLHN